MKQLFAVPTIIIYVALSACSGDKDEGGMTTPTSTPTPSPIVSSFDVTLVNITHNQPLSPPVVVFHESEFTLWTIGESASAGLELLSEAGDASLLVSENPMSVNMVGASVVAPSDRVTIAIDLSENSFSDGTQIRLSLASMLVNTNDAFAGLTGVDISQLSVGDSLMLVAPIYDAGTEANSETAATIPGPAAAGEGFNIERDDVNFVARHSGVVSLDDGLNGSILDQSHRFDNSAMRVIVTRTQ